MNHQEHNSHSNSSEQMDRAHHERIFQRKFWVSLLLSIPVLPPWRILLSLAVGALLMSISTVIVAINAQLLRNTDLSATAAINPKG